MSYQVILITTTSIEIACRSYGAHRLASELRAHGYSTLVISPTCTMDFERFKTVISKAVGDDTLMVGFSTTWFPDRVRTGEFFEYEYYYGEGHVNEWARKDRDPWWWSSVTWEFSGDQTDKYIDYIKQINPRTKVVVGGAQASQYITEPKLDNIFIGNGESQMLDYINSISGRGPKRIFNKVINYDIDSLNNPAFNFNTSVTTYTEEDFVVPKEHMQIEFSRGCIFNCGFCSFPGRNAKTKNYTKTQDTIYKELMDNYTKWGIDNYSILDDTFNDYTEKLELIHEVIQSLPFKLKFWCYCRLDLTRTQPKQLKLMKEMGIVEVYYGLDTWHDKSAKILNKASTVKNKMDTFKQAKEVWGDDVVVSASIIVGSPCDTVKSIYDSVDWYVKEGHKYAALNYNHMAIRPYNNPYSNLSDIDKDPAKYGYSFPDPTRPLYWVRNDEGDIYNQDIAKQVQADANAIVEPYAPSNHILTHNWELFSHIEHPRQYKLWHLYRNHLEENYWPKLIELLDRKKI